ncbi:hypothetical protein K493DRAFT_390296 [Basidiobolus meristosporus CBS 931.73]|uniref:Uncharacterized protein n=1 Tax=Basidiobolus meristosporus CBS 931.73 TaxID=1314790 RepID=A0A1Y1X322_9FUNG|nr:hypothetical protein K493DRAFT_390296 [Basidiobolus meristosporus CBS 931.73]|eukprot:ORX80092.1 hypothetical protein K493DRAFT_390296 [Basidiobolus meristosporus CBS 931.73]
MTGKPYSVVRFLRELKSRPGKARFVERKPAPRRFEYKLLPNFERELISTAQVKMLSSPLRKCVYNERVLPKDFLLRLVKAEVPETSQHVVVCDMGLGGKKLGKGKYVQSRRAVVEALYKDGRYNYVAQGAFYRADMHKHVGCLLATKTLSLMKNTLKQSRFANRMSWVNSHRTPTSPTSIHIDFKLHPIPSDWIYDASKGGVLTKGKGTANGIFLDTPGERLQFILRFPKGSLDSITPVADAEVKYQSSINSIEDLSEIMEYSDAQCANEDGTTTDHRVRVFNAARLYADQLGYVVNELQIDLDDQDEVVIGVVKSPETVNWAVSMLQLENYFK